MALSLLSLGSSRFFSMASRKAYARLQDFEDARIHSNSDSFNGLVGPCQLRSRILHGLEVQMSNGFGGSTFDARDGVTLHHWWSFSKLISMKPQKISSIFKPVIMEEICWKGLSLLLIHGLSWTIMDYHWWVEIWSPHKYIMNHDTFSILSSSHAPRAILKGLHNMITELIARKNRWLYYINKW